MTLQVQTSQRIGRSATVIFDAIVDPDKMSGYFITKGSARMEAGKTVVWNWADHGDMSLEIRIKDVEPDRSITFEWDATGISTLVRIELKPDGDMTEVTVSDGPFEPDAQGIARYAGQLEGWVNMLMCLKGFLEYGGINLRKSPTHLHSVEVDGTIRATPEEVFRAWSGHWEGWFANPGSAAMRPEVGAPFYFEATDWDGTKYPHYGRFLRLQPGRLVEHTWMVSGLRAETQVTVELSETEGGTRVHLTHSRVPDAATATGLGVGWKAALESLDNHLGG